MLMTAEYIFAIELTKPHDSYQEYVTHLGRLLARVTADQSFKTTSHERETPREDNNNNNKNNSGAYFQAPFN